MPNHQVLLNPKVKQAETSLRRANRLLDITQNLSTQYKCIIEKGKHPNAEPVKKNIQKNFSEMQEMIKKERLAIAQEFHRLRALDRTTPLEKHPQLKALKAMSDKLQTFSDVLQKQEMLALAPVVSQKDVWMESMPLAPTNKVVIDRKEIDNLIKSANYSWPSILNKADQFAKERGVSVRAVKENIIEVLAENRYEILFGSKPIDKSRPSVTPDEVAPDNHMPKPGGRR
jgi:hypothetical protein